jgi:hypothetical protein
LGSLGQRRRPNEPKYPGIDFFIFMLFYIKLPGLDFASFNFAHWRPAPVIFPEFIENVVNHVN